MECRRRVCLIFEQFVAQNVLRVVVVPDGGEEVRQVKVKVIEAAIGVRGQAENGKYQSYLRQQRDSDSRASEWNGGALT